MGSKDDACREIGLSQWELCDRLYLDYRVVALSAKQLNLSTHDFLQQETGWVLAHEHYYPPKTSAAIHLQAKF